MRIAVVGGTGLVGRHTVAALRQVGHQIVVVSRSRGVDLTTGRGLHNALTRIDAVIDVSSTVEGDLDATLRFFESSTKNLLAAEQTAGVKHHVLLSILNLDRVKGNAHLAGKRLQEQLVSASAIPWTIVRAAQFHEFAGMVVDWTRTGDTALVAPVLLQPVAAEDVGNVLATIVDNPSRGRFDLAGPQTEDLFDMARRTMQARGESIRLVPSWRSGIFGLEAVGEVMLPGPDARLAPTTFDTWLEKASRRGVSDRAQPSTQHAT